MVKKKQETNPGPPQVDPQGQFKQLLESILAPIQATMQSMTKGMMANTQAIEALAAQKSQPLIPPELTKVLIGAIPQIITGLLAPDAEEAGGIAKGAYTEPMREAMEQSFINNQKISTQILQASLDAALIKNKETAGRLTEEY